MFQSVLCREPRQLAIEELVSVAERKGLALAELPMLVIVGLTGVGKTTTLEALQQLGRQFSLLPDRREMTERFVIAYMQVADGQAVRKISRFERYPYIQRFREQFPGGMAHVLTTLALENTSELEFPLFFNGLRGENEIRYAVEALPQARFVALTAPDVVRVQRLLKRNDPHDRIIEAAHSVVSGGLSSFAALGVPEAESMFTPVQEQELLELARNGTVSQTELRDKLRIMVEEYHTYNQSATLAALQNLAPIAASLLIRPNPVLSKRLRLSAPNSAIFLKYFENKERL